MRRNPGGTMGADRMEIISGSEERTVAIGRAIGKAIASGTVVVLEGELGSGKTRLTWGIAEGLGLARSGVSSPTYSLVHEYAARGGLRLIHADAYRMDSAEADDFETLLGIESEGGWIAIIEWGSRIADLLPEDRVTVTMSHRSETVRSIEVEGEDRLIERLRAALDGSTGDG